MLTNMDTWTAIRRALFVEKISQREACHRFRLYHSKDRPESLSRYLRTHHVRSGKNHSLYSLYRVLSCRRPKALRRSFRKDGHANDAYFVFDYIFREIFGNEGYYIRYTDDFVGDTADFCYVNESFVIDVIKKCIELDLFDKGSLSRTKF